MKEQEKWSKVKSLPPNVEVSDQGHVRIYDDAEHFHEVTLKTYNGIVCFNVNYKTVQVHRAVAEAFVPNPKEYRIVKHKNGDKTDNRAENLFWTDNSENLKNAKTWRTRIYCLERDIVYGSLHTAANATALREIQISKAIEENATIGGFTFKQIEASDRSYDEYDVKYMEDADMYAVLKECKSIEEYNEIIRKMIEG